MEVTDTIPPGLPDQHGRTILITGANSGLGLRSAEALAAAGGRVLLACRNPDKAAAALDQVAALATGPAPEVITLDLADLDSVAAASSEVAGRVDHLDVLMNNAGVMAIPRRTTAQGFEMQFGTNHLGHFALTGHLLPLLLAADAPRVVTVSSQGHRIGRMRWNDLQHERFYERWTVYGQSKLANLLFTSELHRRAQDAGSNLIAAAAHPGYAATNLSHNGPGGGGANRLMDPLVRLGDRLLAQSDSAGALPQLRAATAADVVGDDYYGPDGLFEQRGDHPKRVGRSKAARDPQAARRLWERSEVLTGVSYDWG